MVQVLLDAKADVNARDVDEETPLHYATKLGSPALVDALLAAGPDLSLANVHGHSPPAVALTMRSAELFKRFCEHDALLVHPYAKNGTFVSKNRNSATKPCRGTALVA